MIPAPSVVPIVPRSERDVPRPRAQSIGAVLLVAGAVSMLFVPAGPLAQCGVWAFEGATQTYLLLSVVVAAGLALLVRLPKCSAVAPALALGAALPMLGAALASWGGFLQGSCAPSDSLAVLLVVESAGALAVASCSTWLLYARDEIEPWYGTRGVVVSSILGALIVFIGMGVDLAGVRGGGELTSGAFFVSGPLVWAAVVALCGWLRRTPAIALTTCSFVQVTWLLLR